MKLNVVDSVPSNVTKGMSTIEECDFNSYNDFDEQRIGSKKMIYKNSIVFLIRITCSNSLGIFACNIRSI